MIVRGLMFFKKTVYCFSLILMFGENMKNSLQAIRNITQGHIRDISGQAITEYVSMVAIFLGLVLMLVTLLRVFSDYGWRILGLVGMDYP